MPRGSTAKTESLQVKLQVKKFCASPNDVCGLWENSLRVGGTVFRQNQAVSFVKNKPHIAEKLPSFRYLGGLFQATRKLLQFGEQLIDFLLPVHPAALYELNPESLRDTAAVQIH